MKHCPNVDCAHYRAVGSPAEYVADIALCTDCGATLLAGAAPEPAAAESALESPLRKRLLVTLIAVPALFALPWVTLPGVDGAAVKERFATLHFAAGLRPPATTSVFALGLTPFLYAALLVGLAMLVVPRWRQLEATPEGRRKVRIATLATTLALTAFQSFGIARLLDALPEVYSGSTPVTMLSLMTGTMLLVGGAEVLSRHGLVNGFSALIAFGILGTELERAAAFVMSSDNHAVTPWVLAQLVAAPLVAMFALSRLIQPQRRIAPVEADAPSAYREAASKQRDADAVIAPVVRLPASGIGPLAAGTVLLSAVNGDVWFALRLPDVMRAQVGVAPVLIGGVAAAAVALVLSLVLHSPERVARLWSAARPDAAIDPRALSIARTEVRRAAIRTAALLGGLAALGIAGSRSIPLFPAALSYFVLGAVALDLLSEWRARKAHGELATIAVPEDIDAVDATLFALDEARIPAHARGARHRSLLQIFGAYVPVEIMVAPDRADEAREVAKRFGGA